MNSSKYEYQVGLLGFGEAGQSIAKSLINKNKIKVAAYDKNYKKLKIKNNNQIKLTNNLKELAKSSKIIISVVTADQSFIAAKSIYKFLGKDHIYFDGNSVSPGTKKKTEKINKKIRYIDMAIMAPINPNGYQTKILLSGNNQKESNQFLKKYKFNYEWKGKEIGSAAVVKMLRSIMIKGTEALLTETVTAANKIGLDDKILKSAEKTLNMKNITGLADYFMERCALHGLRRAEEMNEVVKTLKELKSLNFMASAIAKHQKEIGKMNLKKIFKNKIPQNRKIIAKSIQKKLLKRPR